MPWFRGFKKFLNSPFGIWLLSSIVIGLLVNFVTEEQQCYTTGISFAPKLAKSTYEMDVRIIRIAHAIYKGKDEDASTASVTAIMNGHDYVYMEYKDKTIIDVKADIFESARALTSLGQKVAVNPESLYSNINSTLALIADYRLGYEPN